MAKEENPMDLNGTVFVGTKKPTMNYVLATVMSLNNDLGNGNGKGKGKSKGKTTTVIKARGRAISIAVDTAEITVNRFVPAASVKSVAIGTEEVGEEHSKVSNIEIVLEK